MAGSRLESEDSRARKSSGPIVSVIDDDAGTRDALADLFDTVGYQTYKFNDAEDFLRSGAAHVSGVLITDIQLDGIDGLTLMDLIASQARLPIIVITGRPEEELHLRAISKGCAAFLRKPFDPTSLLAHVKAALSHG